MNTKNFENSIKICTFAAILSLQRELNAPIAVQQGAYLCEPKSAKFQMTGRYALWLSMSWTQVIGALSFVCRRWFTVPIICALLKNKEHKYMKTAKITVQAIQEAVNAPKYEFPKYTTQVINLVNGNAQGTRPAVVGQMSELIQQFPGQTLEEWIDWYNKQQPKAVDNATDRIFEMFQTMHEAASKINKEMIRKWVEDLVYTKTFCGLKFQEAILKHIAGELGVKYRLATIEEEAQNIDGFINDKPVQIKSDTYKYKNTAEVIDVPIVYYEKRKSDIVIEYDPNDFL